MDGPEFVFSGLDAFGCHSEPQVADFLIAEHRFVDVHFEVVVGQPLEDLVQGLEVRIMGVALDQQVVYVDDAVLDSEQDFLHEALKRGWTA